MHLSVFFRLPRFLCALMCLPFMFNICEPLNGTTHPLAIMLPCPEEYYYASLLTIFSNKQHIVMTDSFVCGRNYSNANYFINRFVQRNEKDSA